MQKVPLAVKVRFLDELASAFPHKKKPLLKGACWWAKAKLPPRGRSIATGQQRKQAQDLEVKPNQGNHEAEGAHPFHQLGRALVGRGLDEIEVHDQVQRGDDHDGQLDADAEQAHAHEGYASAEHAGHHVEHVEEGDSAGGDEHAALELGRGLDDAGLVEEEHHEKDGHGEADGLQHDATEDAVVEGGDGAQGKALGHGVNGRCVGRPLGLEDGGKGQHQAADGSADEPRHDVGAAAGQVPDVGARQHQQHQHQGRLVDGAFHCHAFRAGRAGEHAFEPGARKGWV